MNSFLHNAMQLQALRARSENVSTLTGLVTSYDPNKYAVKVTLEPDEFDTGFIPFAAAWVGNGWGMYAPPSIGQRVSVTFEGNDINAGFAEASFYDAARVPLVVQSGEFWLVHAKGAYFKLLNTGAVTFSDSKGATVTLSGDGKIASAGAWTHTGDFKASGTITGQTDVLGGPNLVSLINHLTTLVQAGSGTSGPPAP